jgi:hypothetical protein
MTWTFSARKRVLNSGGLLESCLSSRYAPLMESSHALPGIYQLRIVMRGISPLIWRRLLVRRDTTLAQLHYILQLIFDWSGEHLHEFHIYGKDYGDDGADTRDVRLSDFRLHPGERFGMSTILGPTGNAISVWKRAIRSMLSGIILCVSAVKARRHPNTVAARGPIWR